MNLDGRCGTCARFVRVTEAIDENGEVRRSGQCLLGVWPTPLYETNTCSQYVKRGEVALRPRTEPKRPRHVHEPTNPQFRSDPARPLNLPEDLLSMDADEFRNVLREVIRDELGVSRATIGGRWEGGEVILKPGKEGIQEKRIPIESLFHKVVMIRDKLRVLEQKLNSNPRLNDEEKVQMQQYITQCYGSLTTFNVLFADRKDAFTGQKGDND
jgi:hypothetical protein